MKMCCTLHWSVLASATALFTVACLLDRFKLFGMANINTVRLLFDLSNGAVPTMHCLMQQ